MSKVNPTKVKWSCQFIKGTGRTDVSDQCHMLYFRTAYRKVAKPNQSNRKPISAIPATLPLHICQSTVYIKPRAYSCPDILCQTSFPYHRFHGIDGLTAPTENQ